MINNLLYIFIAQLGLVCLWVIYHKFKAAKKGNQQPEQKSQEDNSLVVKNVVTCQVAILQEGIFSVFEVIIVAFKSELETLTVDRYRARLIVFVMLVSLYEINLDVFTYVLFQQIYVI